MTTPLIDEHELEDMARSEYETAMSFGISLDNFMRLARTILKRATAAQKSDGAEQLSPEEVADQVVNRWSAAGKMPQMAWDFRGLVADGIRTMLAAARCFADTEAESWQLALEGVTLAYADGKLRLLFAGGRSQTDIPCCPADLPDVLVYADRMIIDNSRGGGAHLAFNLPGAAKAQEAVQFMRGHGFEVTDYSESLWCGHG